MPSRTRLAKLVFRHPLEHCLALHMNPLKGSGFDRFLHRHPNLPVRPLKMRIQRTGRGTLVADRVHIVFMPTVTSIVRPSLM